jgi:hypothetical protein
VKRWVFTLILGNCSPLKTDCKPYYFITMSKQLLISMLRKGANGEQILSILDVIASDTVTEETSESFAEPTLDEIAF